ncbi:hypothetical protein [Streptomyces sp. NPDC001404]|uniref:hypothetical protein n=1 Tax=Streptomyces sp. NPDC001404 TaxID=3364571 RepID=UPI0036B6F3B9
MKRFERPKLIVALLALLAMLTAVPASAITAPNSRPRTAATAKVQDTSITGLYQLNANGSTGTLHILSVNQGQVQADMRYDAVGFDEHVSGTWDGSARTLTLVRPFGPAPGNQTYTLWLGGSTAYPAHLMFGGYFTESGAQYGAYANYIWNG